MFPACTAEMLPNLRLKTGRLPGTLTGSDQVRFVMFMTGRFAFKYVSSTYVSIAGLSGGGVLVLKHDRMGSFSRC